MNPVATTFSNQLIHQQKIPRLVADELRDFLIEINKEGVLPKGELYTKRMVKFIDENGSETILQTNISLENLKLKIFKLTKC